MSTKVLIADNHRIMREGLRLTLGNGDGLKVIGEASNGREAVELAAELVPDVVLTEVDSSELEDNQIAYDIEFTSELSSQDLPLMTVDDSSVVNGSVASEDVQPGLDTGLNDVQVMTVNATAGTYQLELYLPFLQLH